MRTSIATFLLLACIAMVGGCGTTRAQPSPSRDGKCHSDFNAPDCVYLF